MILNVSSTCYSVKNQVICYCTTKSKCFDYWFSSCVATKKTSETQLIRLDFQISVSEHLNPSDFAFSAIKTGHSTAAEICFIVPTYSWHIKDYLNTCRVSNCSVPYITSEWFTELPDYDKKMLCDLPVSCFLTFVSLASSQCQMEHF